MFITGNQIERSALASIPTPVHTRTHRPIPHVDLVNLIESTIDDAGIGITGLDLGTGRRNNHLYGRFHLDLTFGDGGTNAVLGFRNSLDKTYCIGACGGLNVGICMNGIFSGDAFRIARKNTRFGARDIAIMLREAVRNLAGEVEDQFNEYQRLNETAIGQNEGYQILGLAYGQGYLTATQNTVAVGDWTNARHPEFRARTLGNLYQCMTEGLKRGAAGGAIDRHVRAHEFITRIQRFADDRAVKYMTRLQPSNPIVDIAEVVR